MKRMDKTAVIAALVTLAPMLLGAALYSRLPDTIATHWGVSGEPDGWSSKAMACFGIPLFMAALELACSYFAQRETRQAAMPNVLKNLCLWIIPALSLTLMPITLFIALGAEIQVERIVPTVIGLLFIVIGNYLPKCRQNQTMGVRLPWTLKSEENWNRTHRATGYVWIACGAAMIAAGWSGNGIIGIIAIAVMGLFPLAYSFALHKRGI